MARKTTELDVVAAVQERTAQAAALAEISGQHLLTDPRLNPATRGNADELLTDELRKSLRAGHSRALRRLRVADARAAEAERTLEAIALARRASSPARSVMALHGGRRVYARLAVGASVVLAAGSAMGVEAAAHALAAPTGTGYIAELGLTGLSTAAITYRAHLAEHRGELVKKSWQARSLWALMIVPLLVSVGCNLGTTNVVGAFCAIGAAAFALLGAVVADRSAAAMQARADEVDDADEAELHAVAMGEDLGAAVAEHDSGHQGDGGVQEDDRPALAAPMTLAWNWDNSPGIPEWRDPGIEESRDSTDLAGGHIVGPSAEDGGQDAGGHIDAEQPGRDPGGDEVEEPDRAVLETYMPDGVAPDMARVLAAAAARRAAGEQTRARVAGFLERHPDATVAQIADGLQVSETTAKRHRRALRGVNGVEL